MMRYDARSLNLLWELTVSQYKLKDQSTFFGFLWSLLNPLFMVGVLFIFFHAQLGGTVEHYGIYLLLGLVQYTHFANSTTSSMRVLLTMRPLTKEAVFPKELLVVSSTISHTIDFLIGMGFCVIAAYAFGDEALVEYKTITLLAQSTAGWKFIPEREAVRAGDTWKNPDFDDANWRSGKAPMPSDGEEATNAEETSDRGVKGHSRCRPSRPIDVAGCLAALGGANRGGRARPGRICLIPSSC